MRSAISILFAALMMMAGPLLAAPVKIALIDPLTGPMASTGLPVLEHLRFDARRLNANGGFNGDPIEIIGLDNKINPQESLVQLQKAIDEGARYIVQGNGSAVGSALIAAVDKYNRRNPGKEVLYLNHGAVEPSFTNERCSFWHFRFEAHSDMKMKALTDWIAKRDDIKKIYLINQDYSFGHALAEAARTMLKEKRPDIEIVGTDFHPLSKVKDFTPYVSKIKASGADAIITGNWGQDITLLVKAAAEFGLNVPFLTYYGGSPGVVSQLGEQGVDRIYEIYGYYGDTDDDAIGERQKQMYEDKKWDYFLFYPRITVMLEMLQKAADKAGSNDPVDVARALEGLSLETSYGTVTMRGEDHQLQTPLFVSVLKDDMPYGAEGTDFNFAKLDRIEPEAVTMPATGCRMRRPK
ncbi:branched-chain amino acid ABC transporter substrate-binding protein [Alloalcanivorax xenomutans]|uniref:Branched-chain amino acid ABC transporter substrate-binding protein n=1 Tax=Alloalcanivorax xenomutans TaxID=1094342 RepID=A0A9Q3W7Y0_9GAMM|nr:branched-chain amino acid ABC transporter substrate-binding protein [Alloalcanivorax xenomutans]KYZ87495.1 branched-chain amino acid ABC transporter substrate-binding protein [Alcanivorax sp. KX64203]MBA4721167.1 branched-chain amino acid ABC transporter substrate-binding protein [Alcanivorax sp.]MCE7510576.1 branched-chain amino acid ABC transporter substrate-binding protein [Alloalcanivorax xenomutans]MCE7522542.1 branched-chain amino acid ABC transporter substrate-binding protein [Alloalc